MASQCTFHMIKSLINAFFHSDTSLHVSEWILSWINLKFLTITHRQHSETIYFHHPHSYTHNSCRRSDINNFSHHKTSPKHEFDLWNQKRSVKSSARGFPLLIKITLLFIIHSLHTHSTLLPRLLSIDDFRLIGKILPHIVMLVIKIKKYELLRQKGWKIFLLKFS